MKLTELSNNYLIGALTARDAFLDVYPELAPIDPDEVKKILKERTGKAVEDIDEWMDWYISQDTTDKESVIMLKMLHGLRKRARAKGSIGLK